MAVPNSSNWFKFPTKLQQSKAWCHFSTPSLCRKFKILFRLYVQISRGHLCRQMGLAGSGKCYDGGEINAHIRLCLPARAQAQHLLGCVWAELCEGLQPKALTTHYTADKAICEESFLKAVVTFLLCDCWRCRFALLSNIVRLHVRALTCMLEAIIGNTSLILCLNCKCWCDLSFLFACFPVIRLQ